MTDGNTTTTITARITCPACDGRGKRYGSRQCGYCMGRHKVTETVTIDHAGRTSESKRDTIERVAREVFGNE